jgi:alpha-beta hydrolase superfamily lysophospholipase
MTRTWAAEGACRGTVVVLRGRGEDPSVYQRFGRQLAADGYTVVVPEADDDPATCFQPGAARFLAGTDVGRCAPGSWRWRSNRTD